MFMRPHVMADKYVSSLISPTQDLGQFILKNHICVSALMVQDSTRSIYLHVVELGGRVAVGVAHIIALW